MLFRSESGSGDDLYDIWASADPYNTPAGTYKSPAVDSGTYKSPVVDTEWNKVTPVLNML